MKLITNIIERYDRPFEYFGVLLKLLIVFQFWTLWSAPQPEDAMRINNFATLMAFEFVMVHSGIFMSVFPKKISLYFFVPLYGLFALAFVAAIEDNTILIIYLFVVFNRMRFAFSDVPKWMRDRAIFTSVIAMIIYFLLIFVSVGIPFPELGLNQEYLETVQFASLTDTSGIFIDTPHIAMVFGVMYYLGLAIFELYLIRRFRHKYQNPTPV
jgi:hypothetical protein